ncbi:MULTISPECIES: methyltransferase [Kaistia]|uniref:Methyltransferase n=1 Tax=Kaistia nematophila TaxID=2994654 RepID=A0A9X3E2Z3_9HYPH|nr:methyltransferase [Kaistia nematophila]MBN9024643.1 methyltransferase domain-containing protein [Hyphomicrobiales bacterium]MCX5570804.1 methyltransferase [Kaistia nematophila]
MSREALASVSEINPEPFIEAVLGFRDTAAIKAAIDLDLFTALAEGATEPAALAIRTGASERGLRILCDYLTLKGFLAKADGRYAPSPSSAVFLDRRSPAYMGGVADFLAAPEMMALFLDDPVSYVRHGGSLGLANMAPENPIWIKFAKAMVPLVLGSAQGVAAEVATWSPPPRRVLDIAAGHGFFGISVAKAVPGAAIVAVDWPDVVALAAENAKAAGLDGRYATLPGSAFDVDWGRDFDLVLLPNFLHHFDHDTCVSLLEKARASLAPGGRVIAVEQVPDAERISPPWPAGFALIMLATTQRGDAYTEAELGDMARDAGFSGVALTALPPSPASLVLFEA